MAGFTTTHLNGLLDGNALEPNLISLHNGDPGGSGTANEISGGGYTRQAATFAAASSGARALNAAVDFSGTAAQGVTYFGIWNSTGPTFLGGFAISSGDVAFNASGEYQLTTDTEITIANA